MLDKITSVFENYNTKIKNPLFGTIISVWLIHNWRIPYALFNFDKECTLQDKINFIADYFGKQNFWEELFNIIGYSFLVLIFSFALMAISRALTDFYYKIVEPFIIIRIDSKEVFTNEKKLELEINIKKIEENLNSKREELTRVENINQSITIQRDNLRDEMNSLQSSTSSTIEQLNLNVERYDNFKNTIDHLYSKFEKIIFDSLDEKKNTLNKLATRKLKENHKINIYEEIQFLRENGMLYKKLSADYLNLTGEIFLDYYRNKYLDII